MFTADKEPNSHLNARTPEENSTVRDQNTSAGVVTTTRKELFPGSLIIPLDPATGKFIIPDCIFIKIEFIIIILYLVLFVIA